MSAAITHEQLTLLVESIFEWNCSTSVIWSKAKILMRPVQRKWVQPSTNIWEWFRTVAKNARRFTAADVTCGKVLLVQLQISVVSPAAYDEQNWVHDIISLVDMLTAQPESDQHAKYIYYAINKMWFSQHSFWINDAVSTLSCRHLCWETIAGHLYVYLRSLKLVFVYFILCKFTDYNNTHCHV